jgi:hypothetical protein
MWLERQVPTMVILQERNGFSHSSFSIFLFTFRQALKPGINRAPWESHEDLPCRHAGKEESWPVIATFLPGRIAESVRERYMG